MKKVLVDTNVILDVFLERQPHRDASAAVWAAIETRTAEGLLSAHAVTTIHYLYEKRAGRIEARQAVAAILRVFGIATINRDVIQDALDLPFADFEDAVTCAAAQRAQCDLIVTRDPRGFRGSHVLWVSPEQALPLLNLRDSS